MGKIPISLSDLCSTVWSLHNGRNHNNDFHVDMKGSIPPWLPEDSRRVSPQCFQYLLKNFKTLNQPCNWPHWDGSFFIRRVIDRHVLDNHESFHQGKTKMEYLSFMAQLQNLVEEPNISTWTNKINKPTISVSFAVNTWEKINLNWRIVSILLACGCVQGAVSDCWLMWSHCGQCHP